VKWVIGITVGLVACRSHHDVPAGSGAGAGSASLDSRLRADTSASWFVHAGDGVASLVRVDPAGAPKAADPAATARAFVTRYAASWGVHDPEHELVVERSGADRVVFRQQHGSVPVEGGYVAVSLERGVVVAVDARYVTPPTDPPGITAAAARDQIREQLVAAATAAAPEGSASASTSANTSASASANTSASANLTVAMPTLVARGVGLVYRAVVTFQGGAATVRVVADARDGSIIAIEPRGRDLVAAQGKGVHAYHGDASAVRDFQVVQVGDGGYELHHPATATLPEVTVRALEPGSKHWRDVPIVKCFANPPEGAIVRSRNPTSWDERAPPDDRGNGAAVDLYVNLDAAAAFYAKLGRRSYDGRGAPLVGVVHTSRYSQWSDGHFWYGDTNASDDRTWYPATTFDGVVHEMTHAVCESMWGAWSWDVEPGAISEGIADVFAAIAEHERKAGPENLLLGEQAVVPRSGQCKAIRDLVHPKACGGVDHAQDLITGSASVSDFFDRCSTGDASHENGGVVGNAFALMTVGGTNESSGVTIAKGIGWEAAKTVWWTALEAMSKDSRFENLANLTIGVAQKNRLDLTPVICAWFAVGVLNADDVATHKVTCTPPEPTAAADAGIAIDAGVAADAAPGTVVIPPGGAASGPWICMLTTDGNCTCLMRVLAGVGMEMEQARGTVKIVPACTAAMVPGPAACALAKSSGHPAICGCAKNVAGTAAMKFGAVEWSPVPRCPPP